MNSRIPFLLAALFLTGILPAAPEENPERTPELPESLVQANAAAQAGDFDKAASLLKQEAEKGNADAAFGLAEFYILGQGVPASATEGLKWYEKAGEAGIAMALFRQGEIYLRGATGVEANEDRGKFLLQSAAEAGVPPAWTMLGDLEKAKAQAADAAPDREKFFSRAREHYLKAAEAGNHQAQESIANLLGQGLGGDADPKTAFVWLKKAAIGGRSSAMNELGLHYQRGTGQDDDPVSALGWFLAGAERGSLPAMTNLGLCYAKGLGIPQNNDKAGSWFAQASKQHFPPAQHLLGQMFEEGRGTEKNLTFAYVNYSRAADAGLDAAAKARDALKKKLTEAQLKDAERLLKPAPAN